MAIKTAIQHNTAVAVKFTNKASSAFNCILPFRIMTTMDISTTNSNATTVIIVVSQEYFVRMIIARAHIIALTIPATMRYCLLIGAFVLLIWLFAWFSIVLLLVVSGHPTKRATIAGCSYPNRILLTIYTMVTHLRE